jgi:eukaryotic-like serine/threonine-protein kinase
MRTTCPTCGATYAEGDRFCPVDGTLLEPAPTPPPRGEAGADEAPAQGPTRALKPVRPTTDWLTGKVIDNRYRVGQRIGEGGIGAVYEAEHVQIKRKVAVKVLHPSSALNAELRTRFEREALAASKVTHPGCVQVIDFGTFEGRSYLVMEFVEGALLGERISRAPVPPAETVALVVEILAALGHAHSLGIVHRDMKPSNVMLCDKALTGSNVKILDFGLAKNLRPEVQGAALTRVGTIFGTPGYIPPEQALGKAVDARGDLYSMGIILFEMLCGRKPFVCDDDIDMFKAHILTTAPRVRTIRPDLSEEMEALIARVLEKDRELRPRTADEFITALSATPEARSPAPPVEAQKEGGGAALLAAPAPVVVAAPPLDPRRRLRGHRLPLVLGLAIAVVVALIATVLLVRKDGVKPAARPSRPDTPLAAAPRQTAAPSVHAPAPVERRAVEEPAEAAKKAGPPPEVAPPPHVEAAPPSAPLRRAESALAAGHLDAAVKDARTATKLQHDSPRPYVVLGHAYHAKMWYTDALEEYAKAIRRDPSLRNDKTIIRHAIRALAKASAWHQAARFLVRDIGPPAVPALKEVATGRGDPDQRKRAAAVLERLAEP